MLARDVRCECSCVRCGPALAGVACSGYLKTHKGRAKTDPLRKDFWRPLRDVGTVRRWSSTLGPRHASGGTGLCSGIIPAALAVSTPTLAHNHLL
jgi:hypothetical protein